jgi:hypothetical protein
MGLSEVLNRKRDQLRFLKVNLAVPVREETEQKKSCVMISSSGKGSGLWLKW